MYLLGMDVQRMDNDGYDDDDADGGSQGAKLALSAAKLPQ